MSAQITYTGEAGAATLTFVRGPLNFRPYWDGRVHDGLATSGAERRRVVEHLDILIRFDMPHMVVADDMPDWGAFEAFALAGGEFQFWPCDALESDYYNCVLEDVKWEPMRNAPGKYTATVLIRILQNSQAPTGPDVVLQRFHGIGAPA